MHSSLFIPPGKALPSAFLHLLFALCKMSPAPMSYEDILLAICFELFSGHRQLVWNPVSLRCWLVPPWDSGLSELFYTSLAQRCRGRLLSHRKAIPSQKTHVNLGCWDSGFRRFPWKPNSWDFIPLSSRAIIYSPAKRVQNTTGLGHPTLCALTSEAACLATPAPSYSALPNFS